MNGVLRKPYCADSGSDHCVVSRKMLRELEVESGKTMKISKLDFPVDGRAVGGHVVCSEKPIDLKLQLCTAAGVVEIENLIENPVECLIINDDDDEFILGTDVLKALGIDVDRQLEQLSRNSHDDGKDTYADVADKRTEIPDISAIMEQLIALVDKAIEFWFYVAHRQERDDLVRKYDIWRMDLRNDLPASVEPYKIRLKPDAKPYRCKTRKYAPAQSNSMREFNRKLVELGWVYRNQSSRWACPALPVRKPGSNEFRQTCDYKPVNAMTEPLAGTMPNLNTKLKCTKDKKHYGLFDFIKGFWQLPLAKNSQEILSYETDEGGFTPTRVPQGSCDAAIHY
ncbi:hypothetical protein PHMEG_00032925 [Phytophthora megakarya]|uniref:Reverse transcriptase n=1 Tax=Phytophthora megakarya TaxID=4795 RepID=A0A225UTZ4_9STRA|nr:hypothetical protein PHMEG_00032925 [Phytophthora megakarya]